MKTLPIPFTLQAIFELVTSDVERSHLFEYRHDYVEDSRLRDSFKHFLRKIHGLDLELWDRCGYWDRRYMPFSFFDGDEVVSSVCLYSLDMVVSGELRKLAQISGVGTRADLRRRGLNRELTDHAMAWAREAGHDSFFLFSDPDAVPFYRRMGFRPAAEWTPAVEMGSLAPRGGARKLDMDRDEDRELVEGYARRRTQVSNVLGVLSPKLLMFHALYTLRDALFHIEELDVIAAIHSGQDGLVIQDLIGPKMPALAEIYPYFSEGRRQRVSFGFVPDRLQVVEWHATECVRENLHLGGESHFDESRLLFPHTARA